MGVSTLLTPWPAFSGKTKSLQEGGKQMDTDSKSFVPVMLTPYKSDKSIDYHQLDRLTDHYLAAGARGLFSNCLSSEMYELSPEERLKIAKRVQGRVNGKFPVVATGSFGDTLQKKADFTKKMEDTGVDAVIMITAHFAEKDQSDGEMIKNLEKFLKLTEGIPLGTYECPSPYKRILSEEVLSHILPSGRLIYHKDTTEDIDDIARKLAISKGSELGLYNAHIGSAVASLRMGGAGLSPIAGNYYPEIIAWICQHATDPLKKEEVDWLQIQLAKMEPIITKNYQLSSRYFLNQSGMSLELLSRNSKGQLSGDEMKILDNAVKEVNSWKERLGLPLV